MDTIREQIECLMKSVYHLKQAMLPADEYEIGDRGESQMLAEKFAAKVDLDWIIIALNALYDVRLNPDWYEE